MGNLLKHSKINQQPNAYNRGEPKDVFARLVPEYQHPSQTAKPATKQAQAQEDFLRDAPATALCLEFVVPKKQEIDEIQWNCKEQDSFVHG